MLKKNDIVSLEITGMTNEGNGVGKYDGMAVFVPLTAVGDTIDCKLVKLNKSYAYGIVDNIITPSKTRCTPDCEVFSRCGGCSFRHITYAEELRIKQEFVVASFERIGKLTVDFDDILGCDNVDYYRNKAQYPVAQQDGKAVSGFYSRRSHRIIEFTSCRLQPEIYADITDCILEYLNKYHISAYDEVTGNGLLRHIYLRKGEHTNEIMLCLVVTSIKKSNAFADLYTVLAKKFPDIKSIVLNENSRNTNCILGKKTVTVFGADTITDVMCGKKIQLSPLSFYQVNTLQAEKLYGIAADYAGLKGDEILLDLYCGAGTIGLSMADKVKKLIGVEIIPDAIENAKINTQMNNVENGEFICGDASKIAEILYSRGERPSVIIADPARKGCDRDTLEYMAKMSPDKIVMISCNHATASRDCAFLDELGYKIQKAIAVDLFPRTTHVETVVLMSRVDN